MKNTFTLYLVVFVLCNALAFKAGAVCDATFTYSASPNGASYQFNANQQQQSGYTYYHSWWGINGTVQHGANVTANFSTSSVRNVCHSVSELDSLGNVLCSDTECAVINVVISPGCMPHFSINKTQTTPFDINFYSSIGDYTNLQLLWQFSDSTAILNVAAPLHHFNYTGYHTVTLVATDTVANCSDSAVLSIYIDTIIPCNLNLYFNTRQQSYLTPTVKFETTLTSVNLHYLWDFGDGNSSTQATPTHTFSFFGVKYVCLSVTDVSNGCTQSYCSTISVDTCSADIAKFQNSGQSLSYQSDLYANAEYILNATDIHANSFLWDFGDGTSESIILSPTHTYAHAGNYRVCFHIDVPGCAVQDYCDTVEAICRVSTVFSTQNTNTMEASFNANFVQGANYRYEWAFGDGAIASGNYPIHVYSQPGFYQTCLKVTDLATGCVDSNCRSLLLTEWNDTICGHLFVDSNLNGLQDGNEIPLQAATVNCRIFQGNVMLHATTDSAGYYELLVPRGTNLFITAGVGGVISYTLPLNFYYYEQFFTSPNQRQCGFDFGIVTNCAYIRGFVFGDADGNGLLNNGERVMQNQVVKVNNQRVVSSYFTYQALVPVGPVTASVDATGVYAGYNVLPAQRQINAATPGAVYQDNNFGINVPANYNDVRVDLIPNTPVNEFMEARYNMVVSNLGSNVANFKASIVSDNAFTFDYINYPDFAINNIGTRTTTWFGSLPAFSQQLYPAGYYITQPVVLNQDIYNTATVELQLDSDVALANNTDVCHQIVVGPFDPNNKMANESGRGLKGFIDNGQQLKYVINFQNTGTAPAINIVVSDILSSNLDVNSFRFIGSSHQCDTRIVGDTIYFRFSKILLPDSLHNEPESHGWVSFAINLKPNLPFLTHIDNTAAIYFDHNEPVLTNTTHHMIGVPMAIDAIANDGVLVATPNPFTSQLSIKLSGVPEQNYRYEVMDIWGRKTLDGQLPANNTVTINRGNVAAGTYIVVITDKSGVVSRVKVVAQ